MNRFKGFSGYVAALAGGVLAVVGGVNYLQDSQAFMPSEYKTIKRVVNHLATKNDLGDHRLKFTIIAGGMTTSIAEGLKLCKEYECDFYTDLNPFKTYRGNAAKDVNEAIRQSYLSSSIGAWAWPHGVIHITRATFPSYEGKEEFLTCLIAHEISHVINHDSFKDSLRLAKEGKGLKEEKRDLLWYRISRESETNADINATKMVINVGLPRDSCLNQHDYRAKITGIGEETKKDSTHLGYEDRYAAISQFLKTYEGKPENERTRKTTGKWKYNRDLNTLVFTPLSP